MGELPGTPLLPSRPEPSLPRPREGQLRLPESRLELGWSPGKAAPGQSEASQRPWVVQARLSGIMGESALEPGPVPGTPAAGGPVHAVTVVTLLEKLSSMLEGLQERVGGLASRQGGLAGSVLRIQKGLGELSSSHDRTSNRLEQLLSKAERVGSHADVAQERAVFRAAQMQRLEANHGLLVARGKLRVLLFKEEAEIPASAFQKVSDPLGPADQSEPNPEQPEAEVGESSDEEPVESRAQRLRRSGLQKVQSLRKALSSRKGPAAPTPVKPPRLGPGRNADGQPESKTEPEPPQNTEEDPGRPEAAEAAVLQIESAA